MCKRSVSNKICETNDCAAKRHFYKPFSNIISSNFRYQHFVAICRNLGRKVPVFNVFVSSQDREFYPTTSLDEKCIEFDVQTDRNYNVDLQQTYLTAKLKFVKGRGYKRNNRNEIKKEHNEEAKAYEEMAATAAVEQT